MHHLYASAIFVHAVRRAVLRFGGLPSSGCFEEAL